MCTRRLFCGALVAGLLLGIPGAVRALNPIPINNGGFEFPNIYPSGQVPASPDYIPGWVPDLDGPGGGGLWNFKASTYGLFTPPAPQGDQVLWVGYYTGYGAFTQTLPTALTANATYELTGMAGNDLNLVCDYTISLYAFDGTNRNLLTSITKNGPNGLIEPFLLTYDSTGTPYAGQNLQITLYSAGVQTVFDDIHLKTSAAVVPGDINGDTLVNLVDYNILTSHWLQTVPYGTFGDLNSDGKISVPDFSIFKTDYNAFNGGGAENLPPVPEPATLILIALALPGLLYVRRRTLIQS